MLTTSFALGCGSIPTEVGVLDPNGNWSDKRFHEHLKQCDACRSFLIFTPQGPLPPVKVSVTSSDQETVVTVEIRERYFERVSRFDAVRARVPEFSFEAVFTPKKENWSYKKIHQGRVFDPPPPHIRPEVVGIREDGKEFLIFKQE